MTPPPPTPDPTPKADSGAGEPATRAELWITDAPDGMAFQCPDCESCATLGGNAAFHMQSKKHRMPKLARRPLAPAPAPEASTLPVPGRIGDPHSKEHQELQRQVFDEHEYEITAGSPEMLAAFGEPLLPAPEGRGETAEEFSFRKMFSDAEKTVAYWKEMSELNESAFREAQRERDEARAERDAEGAKNAEAEEFTAVRADIVRLSKKVAQYRADFENANYRNEEMRRERDAAVAQAQAASELTARWRNLVKTYVSERSAHGRDDHSCALCAALASSPPALAASEAGK